VILSSAWLREAKLFFSEEKNQKTFSPAQAAISRPWPPSGKLRRNESLLLLFFRKEDSSLSDRTYAARSKDFALRIPRLLNGRSMHQKLNGAIASVNVAFIAATSIGYANVRLW
jgi:tRNA(Leu) C34 or U34 (ribose-2'-O)-methylase TrmL